MDGNREYKSDVFSMLLENKEYALQVYNALNKSDYRNADDMEMMTLDRGISLSVRNDAAFVLDANLSVYEHQSTACNNMPIRSLIYVTMTLERIIRNANIFGQKLVKIPTPRFAVFYNGTANQPEQYDLKLSDAFINQVENPELELKVRVYNINAGRNRELLDNCPVLNEYMIFVDYVRGYYDAQKHENLELAINLAIDRCIKENVLREFLEARRSEVVKVIQLDYTFDRQIELERNDARTEGRAEGRAEGIAEGLNEGIREGEDRALELMQKLFAAGRIEDAKRVTEDPEYRDKLMREFGLV